MLVPFLSMMDKKRKMCWLKLQMEKYILPPMLAALVQTD
jgi:hypothetical protein